jgi:hypothetical protein
MRPRGAYVMGRNMFGPIRGDWDEEWTGWWGPEPRGRALSPRGELRGASRLGYQRPGRYGVAWSLGVCFGHRRCDLLTSRAYPGRGASRKHPRA